MSSEDHYQTRLCPRCLKALLRDVTEQAAPHATIVKCDGCNWKGKLMHAAKKGS